MSTETDKDVTTPRRARHLLGLAPLVAAVLVAGCGGGDESSSSSASPSSNGAATTEQAPAASAKVTTTQNKTKAPDPHKSVKADDPVTRGKTVAKARGERSAEKGTATTPRSGANPCRLVTRSEAGAIVGRKITKMTNAPQGPTCIYELRGGKQPITLAVDATNIAAVRKQGKALSEVKLGGRPAYCVKLGAVKMLVGLSGGRVLNITAPCQIASGFAAKALSRVG